MTGLLKIDGLISLDQFWPIGSSDADTSKIKVTVGENAFRFADDRKHFSVTHAFDEAFVKGKSREKLIDSKSRIVVRLQGIDAPELHYKAGPLPKNRPEVTPKKRKVFNDNNKHERRQYLAETATMALAKKLASFDGVDIDEVKVISCQVYSLVDHPFEVVDTYGRFVGNIRVGSSFNADVNEWLAERGWCYPTFYSSMEKAEIELLLKAMKKAGKTNVWKYYSTSTTEFDPDLQYRRPPTEPHPAADKGPVLMPKLFRRQVAYEMEKKAKTFKGTFKKFLEKSPDACYALGDFIEAGPHSATERKLHEFLNGTKFTLKPHEIVFREKFSTVVDKDGKIVENF